MTDPAVGLLLIRWEVCVAITLLQSSPCTRRARSLRKYRHTSPRPRTRRHRWLSVSFARGERRRTCGGRGSARVPRARHGRYRGLKITLLETSSMSPSLVPQRRSRHLRRRTEDRGRRTATVWVARRLESRRCRRHRRRAGRRLEQSLSVGVRHAPEDRVSSTCPPVSPCRRRTTRRRPSRRTPPRPRTRRR